MEVKKSAQADLERRKPTGFLLGLIVALALLLVAVPFLKRCWERSSSRLALPSRLFAGTAAALWTKYTFCGLFAGLLVARRLKKRYSNLSEEIDELLKEE